MTVSEGKKLIKELHGYEPTDEIVVETLSRVAERLNCTKDANLVHCDEIVWNASDMFRIDMVDFVQNSHHQRPLSHL